MRQTERHAGGLRAALAIARREGNDRNVLDVIDVHRLLQPPAGSFKGLKGKYMAGAPDFSGRSNRIGPDVGPEVNDDVVCFDLVQKQFQLRLVAQASQGAPDALASGGAAYECCAIGANLDFVSA